MMKKLAIVIASSVVLSGAWGCAWDPARSAQSGAGLNEVEVKWQVPENQAGITSAWGRFGKESETLHLNVSLGDGKSIMFNASGLKSFDAIKFRAEVEKRISQDVKDAVPGIVDSIVDSALLFVTP